MSSTNWRSPSTYAQTQELNGPGYAWELLRRVKDYRQGYDLVTTLPARDKAARSAFAQTWGLRFRGRSGPARHHRPDLLVDRVAA